MPPEVNPSEPDPSRHRVTVLARPGSRELVIIFFYRTLLYIHLTYFLKSWC